MMVVVQGTKDFKDYNVFLRAMGVALSNIKNEDHYFYIYSLGSKNINNFVFEFANLSERNLKARGKKIKHFTVPFEWVEENKNSIDYFAYFYNPGEYVSKITENMTQSGIEVGLFQY